MTLSLRILMTFLALNVVQITQRVCFHRGCLAAFSLVLIRCFCHVLLDVIMQYMCRMLRIPRHVFLFVKVDKSGWDRDFATST